MVPVHHGKLRSKAHGESSAASNTMGKSDTLGGRGLVARRAGSVVEQQK